jgi:mono/diheme cytochrome c family protein
VHLSWHFKKRFYPGLKALLVGLFVSLPLAHALTPDEIAGLPPAATHPVDFGREIKPILEASCVKCHGRGRDKGDFNLDSLQNLLTGGESGPAIVPGASTESILIELVAGVDPEYVMPQKGKRLTPAEVGLLRAWIDQGAKWDPAISLGKAEPSIWRRFGLRFRVIVRKLILSIDCWKRILLSTRFRKANP